MSCKQIVVRSEAELDIKDAYEWYECQRKEQWAVVHLTP